MVSLLSCTKSNGASADSLWFWSQQSCNVLGLIYTSGSYKLTQMNINFTQSCEIWLRVSLQSKHRWESHIFATTCTSDKLSNQMTCRVFPRQVLNCVTSLVISMHGFMAIHFVSLNRQIQIMLLCYSKSPFQPYAQS